MLRITVIGPSKYFFSGITAHTIFLANALSERNQVSVVLFRKMLPRFLYPGKAHVNKDNYTINFADGIDVYDGLDWYSPLSWWWAFQFLKAHKPQFIIMAWWSSTIAHMQLFLALANKLMIKARLILDMHEIIDPLEEKILPIKFYSRVMGRFVIRHADMLAAHSAWAKNEIIRIYRIKRDKVSVVPMGLFDAYKTDLDKNSAKEKLGIKEKFVILTFGSIRKYKGVSNLIRAFSALPETIAANSRLVIAGEDWGDDEELHGLIESSSYKNKITLDGHFISDEMIPVYFSAADTVVMPYLRTSGSGVALIAVPYGKPIISSDLGPIREALSGYTGALFVPAGDWGGIKDKIIQVYQDTNSGNIIQAGSPSDSWEKVAQQYEKVIGGLAGQ